MRPLGRSSCVPRRSHAAPSGAVITPWDGTVAEVDHVAGDRRRVEQAELAASCAVNQTAIDGRTDVWGPEPSGTGRAAIVNTGSTRTTTVVVADVDPTPFDDDIGVV